MQRKKLKRCLIGFGCFFLLVGSVILFWLYPEEKKPSSSYSYEIQRKSTSIVHLKENPFYEKRIDQAEKYFAANAIDYYDISFSYQLHSIKKTTFNYKTKLKATLLGNIDENTHQEKEVWKRTFLLHEMSSQISSKDSFELKEQTFIDYSYYQQLVESFEQTYSLTMNTTLKIDFEIEWTDKDKNKTYQDVVTVTIPITDDITSVLKSYKEHSNLGKITVQNKDKFLLLLGESFCLLGVIFLFLQFFFKRHLTPVQIYKKTLRDTFREYKDILVVISQRSDISELKVIFLSNLSDLFQIAVQENKMILYYEPLDKQESYFYLIIENYVYIYHLFCRKK